MHRFTNKVLSSLLAYSKTDETSHKSHRSTTLSIGHVEPTAAGLNVAPTIPKYSLTAENLSAHNSIMMRNRGISEIDLRQSLESLREAVGSLGVELPENILYRMLPRQYRSLYERIHMKHAMSDAEPTNHDSQDFEPETAGLLISDEEEGQRSNELSDVHQDKGREKSSTPKLLR